MLDPDVTEVKQNRKSLQQGRKQMDLSLKKSKSHEIMNNSSVKYNKNISNMKSVFKDRGINAKMSG